MTKSAHPIPSVDEVLRAESGRSAAGQFGRQATVGAVRTALDDYRQRVTSGGEAALPRDAASTLIAEAAVRALAAGDAPRLRRVFNLTGTVLHTNLGRAVLPEAAITAVATAMRHPCALEYDVEAGQRGERDDIIRGLVCELTGAEDAIVVNNNAAAVLLVLNALAAGRDTIVSRGELIEIGGSFRLPAIMASAGTRLVEVGTTNRTHLKDYAEAIGPATGLLMKVHTSNYLVQGFTKEVSAAELAPLAREHGIPLIDDLGSGTLIDLARHGLKRERTVQDALGDGCDLVTFSGDKLLGGPQAGFIVGRRDLVQRCAKSPMKRALRLDKLRLAALEATLRLYRDPDRLPEMLPTLGFFVRTPASLRKIAERLVPVLTAGLGAGFAITIRDCASQIGSGALPLESIPSVALAIEPCGATVARGDKAPGQAKVSGRAIEQLAAAFRRLPIPVVGRIEKGALLLDLRCLDDEARFVAQTQALPAALTR